VNEPQSVELTGDLAVAAMQAAFARLPKPQPVKRVRLRSLDFSRVRGRLVLKVQFYRGPSRKYDSMTFTLSAAWARVIHGRLTKAMQERGRR
jgi:hypothetical protein